NCGAISERLFESEFFGYDRFPGATEPKRGLFEVADGGTLLLDEIGELLPEHQPKLLTVLDTNWVRRVNGTVQRAFDVPLAATTSRALETEVSERRFREDLLARINTFALTVPSLRERRAEIIPMAESFLREARKSNRASPTRLSEETRAALLAHHWPKNVR